MYTVNNTSPVKDDREQIRARIGELEYYYKMIRSSRYSDSPRSIKEAENTRNLIEWLEELLTLKGLILDRERFNFDILRGSITFPKEAIEFYFGKLPPEEKEYEIRKQIAERMIRNLIPEISVEKRDADTPYNEERYIGSLVVARRTNNHD